MPLYEYQCFDGGAKDQHRAGIDAHTALCAKCGGLMLR
jgi:predicted nucleic acid-binding Zn ribbon protein